MGIFPTLKMKDIMSRDVVTINYEATVFDGVRRMVENKIGAIICVDDQEKLLGIFTERDLMRVVAAKKDTASTLLDDVMTKDIMALSPEVPVSEAVKLTQSGKFRHVPIVSSDKLVGIVSIRDINRTFYDGMSAGLGTSGFGII